MKLVPNASTVGLLVNPKDPNAESDTREAQAAADALGQKLVVAEANTDAEIDSRLLGLLNSALPVWL